jgi:hypothetical protein
MKETRSVKTRPLSRILPGPSHLRYYEAYRMVAWQPRGLLDDRLLDEIADWLQLIEKTSLPFKRFVDFSELVTVSVKIDHVFKIAHKRSMEFRGVAPVRSAFFCDKLVGFGVACLYESLMENTLIKARAFRDRVSAAEWLGVPAKILTLSDQPAL